MLHTNAWKQNIVIQFPATIVTVAAMVLVPLATHLLPVIGGVPLGAQLLPMFYAPLLAAVYFHPAVSVVAGLVAPALNHVLTGMPSESLAIILSFELVTFSIGVQILLRRFPLLWVTAPLAFLLAKAASLIALTVLPFELVPTPAWQYTINSLSTAWPGLLVLLALNWLATKTNRDDN